MKLIHLSDLHLGKRVNGFSMLEDQRYILEEIFQIIVQEKPDCVLVAGDVYDKPVPPVEAVELLGDFLNRMVSFGCPVCMISGNHDSAERLSFAAPLIAHSGVYIAPYYRGEVTPVTLQDAYGSVQIYLLPFLRPAQVRAAFPEQAPQIASVNDAVAVAVEQMGIDTAKRNVLVAHQFVTGAHTCESEELSVGGTDQVDASLFEAFDYVALGHIHGPQKIGRETVRYCGTPLKYSFSEASQQKSVTIVELGAKGDVSVRTAPLRSLHDLRECRGSYAQMTDLHTYQGTAKDDYLHITLTDEEDILDAAAKLRIIYPRLMKMDYDNQRTRQSVTMTESETSVEQNPMDLIAQFYEQQNNQTMRAGQRALAEEIAESVWTKQEGDME